MSEPKKTSDAPVSLKEKLNAVGERQLATLEEDERRAHAAKVYQMQLWPDVERAMPSDFIACALFAAVQTKHAPYLRGHEIASINGFTITFTGKRLTQVHADILMGVAHLARHQPQGYVARFSDREFLRLLEREVGTNSTASLRQLFDDLIATAIRITEASGQVSYSGSILTRSADRIEGDHSEFAVEITREFCQLFERGFASVNWRQRLKLKRKPLALWLQLYFSQFHKPVTVSELHRLSGSADELRFFRRRLGRELKTLEDVGSIAQSFIENDVVHVASAGKPLPARFRMRSDTTAKDERQLPETAEAPAGVTTVSTETLAKFRALYPDQSPERCLADWYAWPNSRLARFPSAAFLGYAKKWVAGRK